MPTGGISVWVGALIGALATGLGRIVAAIPLLLGALVILLIGWIVGKLVQAGITKLLHAVHFNRVTEHAGINETLRRADMKADTSAILGIVAYWFIFLIALQAAVNVLGIEALTTLMTAVVLYLPRIFVALVVVIIGAWLGSFLGRLTTGSAEAARISYASLLGSIVQGAVLFFAFAIALDALGLGFPFLTTAFAIVLGALGLAGAIAFGIGGREYASDIMAGRELRAILRTGDRVRFGEMDGTVEDMKPTYTLIRTARGDVAVQNSDLMSEHPLRTPHTPGEGTTRAA